MDSKLYDDHAVDFEFWNLSPYITVFDGAFNHILFRCDVDPFDIFSEFYSYKYVEDRDYLLNETEPAEV